MTNSIESSCPDCGAEIEAEPNLTLSTNSGYLKLSANCDECEFGGVFDTKLVRT